MMPGTMFTPELFRPEVDDHVIPYDHLMRMAAEGTPDRAAIVYHDLTLVYQEVVSMVNSVANSLLELGIRKGDRICLCTGNRPESTIRPSATYGVMGRKVTNISSRMLHSPVPLSDRTGTVTTNFLDMRSLNRSEWLKEL